MEDRIAIIIDNGSGHVKAGLAGTDAPTCVFPAVVGRPKTGKMMPGSGSDKEYFLGNEAMAKKGVLSLVYPISHGIVTDWSDMEKVWHHTFFNELRVNPEEHPVVITEAPMNPRKNRERMLELIFEKFCCPAAYVVLQAVMSLYAYGKTTGMVIDSGDGVTHTVPIYEGYSMPHAIQRLDLAGRDVSEYMCKILSESGVSMTSSAEREIVRDMKEEACYICLGDFEKELANCGERPTDYEKIYTLPDGNKVNLYSERFRVPEIMFQPMLCGRELPGIHESAYKCAQACDIDIRRDLFKNIVLSGGNTMFEGIAERLTRELKALAPQKIDVKVMASPARRYLVWQGASIVSQLTGFHKMLIRKDEYDELGSGIVHQKCF